MKPTEERIETILFSYGIGNEKEIVSNDFFMILKKAIIKLQNEAMEYAFEEGASTCLNCYLGDHTDLYFEPDIFKLPLEEFMKENKV